MNDQAAEQLHLNANRVVWREAGDELVVLELPTSTYLTLNGTAKQLWLGITQGATVESLATLLIDRYGIGADRAKEDAERFVNDLVERQLIERTNDEPST